MSDGYPKLVCLLTGGPTHSVTVSGKKYRFEMHRYSGPIPVNQDGSERLSPVTRGFWVAVADFLQRQCDERNKHPDKGGLRVGPARRVGLNWTEVEKSGTGKRIEDVPRRRGDQRREALCGRRLVTGTPESRCECAGYEAEGPGRGTGQERRSVDRDDA